MKQLLTIMLMLVSLQAFTQQADYVIHIMADDLATGDSRVTYDQSPYVLPYIEALAAQSKVMDFFMHDNVCAAARLAALSGNPAFELGFEGVNPFTTHKEGWGPFRSWLTELTDSYYHTFWYGKHHGGVHRGLDLPQGRGSQYHFGFYGKGGDQFYPESRRKEIDVKEMGINVKYDDIRIRTIVEARNGVLEETTELRSEYKDRSNNTRFMRDFRKCFNEGRKGAFYLNFFTPHSPMQAEIADLSAKLIEMNGGTGIYTDYPYEDVECAIRYCMLNYMDEEVGKIRAMMTELGAWGNTFLIFTSDNGGRDDGAECANNQVTGSNLKGGKGNHQQGALRSLAFARWDGHIIPGRTDKLCRLEDIHPTMTALAGRTVNYPVSGKSLLPLLIDDNHIYTQFDTIIKSAGLPQLKLSFFVDANGDLVQAGWGINRAFQSQELTTISNEGLYRLYSSPNEVDNLILTEQPLYDALLQYITDIEQTLPVQRTIIPIPDNYVFPRYVGDKEGDDDEN